MIGLASIASYISDAEIMDKILAENRNLEDKWISNLISW